MAFAAGSMGPKVQAACRFVRANGGFAAIGSLADAPRLLRREAGTVVAASAAVTAPAARVGSGASVRLAPAAAAATMRPCA